jgi:hypothetical protein
MSDVNYSISQDISGVLVALRPALITPSGGVPVSTGPTGVSNGPVAISAVPSKTNGFLQRLEATCVGAGASAGVFELYLDVAALTPFLRFQQPVANPTAGTRIVWEFPTAIQTANLGDQFAIRHSNPSMGQWVWQVFGFTAAMIKDNSAV